ncbi:MAG TPA: prepilin-type N-terminal cleavage/methylation domain-containing protein, partial [Gammaproteobacteria bacterium]|nr:prepilin-type N-terminal cleavage/methylation domain-containing protein [Gammaproteobacteria bacterium]
MQRASGSQYGYTLIEVLVAFAILAMTLTVLYRIFAAGLNNVGASSEYLQAVQIAEARLEATGVNEALQAGRIEGIELEKFRWTQSVTETPLAGTESA